MSETVLQKGDAIGTKGDAGATGATGVTGAQGAFTNVLSVELKYTFTPIGTPSAVTLDTTYIVEAGASGFWNASGVHSYINADFTTYPGITTLSNFLVDTTKKYSVHLQLLKTKILNSNGTASILLPNNLMSAVGAEIYDTSDDNIIIRFITAIGYPASFKNTSIIAKTRELTFSLLIIGTDQ